ncbi:polysaccharide transport protein, putative [Syntrophobotulus glycolicus DSM 8271]|uniref:Polysaccharide transport protein, putative n=1 Tax=Syntrophobotulus glycolicus (strain DSM 8271 / FlGlyR) TaxID=645991 RepID=F0SX27_SYNGF|nr:polysaccharide transporter [Syntrophobotulus glycolicus]ADY55810.1 polysaccharide transport protein, putative [Syntrophobotulus glycolicus DSM 8271]
MSRTEKFIKNTIGAAVLQSVTLAVGFIIPHVLLVHYGSEVNGLISSLTQFISYFSLLEAGLSGAVVFSLYKPLAQGQTDEISGIVAGAKRFYIQTGYFFCIFVLLLAFLYPVLVYAQHLTQTEIFLLTLILGTNGALEFFTLAKYRSILTADQRTYVISCSNVIHLALYALIVCLTASGGLNIVMVRFLALFSISVRTLLLMLYCRKHYRYLNFNAKPNTGALKQRWDVFYQQLLAAVQSGMPIILTTVILGLKSVSVYTVYYLVIGGINGIMGIFTNGLSAGFGDVIARKETDKLNSLIREFEVIYYFLLSAAYSVTLVMILPFIRLYTRNITDVTYEIPSIAFLFVLSGFCYCMKAPQSVLVIAAGKYKETRTQSTAAALIITGGGIILAFPFGLHGIVAASILSDLYRTWALLLFVTKHITALPLQESCGRILRAFIVCAITVLPYLLFPWSADNIIQWIMRALLVGIHALILAFLNVLVFEPRQLKYLFKRIQSFFKKEGTTYGSISSK